MKIQEWRRSSTPVYNLDCKDPNYTLSVISLSSQLQNLSKLFVTLSWCSLAAFSSWSVWNVCFSRVFH